MIRSFIVFFMLTLLMSCGNYMKDYYPKYHITAFYSEAAGSSSGVSSYLNWGDKLTYMNQSTTNKNKAGQRIIYLKVKNNIDNSLGYVDQDSVIKNPISKGVILGSTIAYETPTILSRNKQSVDPPVLAYIIEIKDKEWAKIEPYNAPLSYSLTDTPGTVPSQVFYPWIYLKEISTNEDNVNFTIALQFAIKKYNDAKQIYISKPDDKKLMIFQSSVKPDRENILNIMKNVPLLSVSNLSPSLSNLVQLFLSVSDLGDKSNSAEPANEQNSINQNATNTNVEQL